MISSTFVSSMFLVKQPVQMCISLIELLNSKWHKLLLWLMSYTIFSFWRMISLLILDIEIRRLNQPHHFLPAVNLDRPDTILWVAQLSNCKFSAPRLFRFLLFSSERKNILGDNIFFGVKLECSASLCVSYFSFLFLFINKKLHVSVLVNSSPHLWCSLFRINLPSFSLT